MAVHVHSTPQCVGVVYLNIKPTGGLEVAYLNIKTENPGTRSQEDSDPRLLKPNLGASYALRASVLIITPYYKPKVVSES